MLNLATACPFCRHYIISEDLLYIPEDSYSVYFYSCVFCELGTVAKMPVIRLWGFLANWDGVVFSYPAKRAEVHEA